MQKNFIIFGLLFAALMAIILTVVLVNNSNASNNSVGKTSESVVGTWHQTHSGMPDVVMTAEVTPGSIEIVMSINGTSSIYWLGSFNSDKSMDESFVTVSNGDQDAMFASIFASGDPTKKFRYKDGLISFDFAMMGQSTTVYLSK